ncbi:PilZ domain-containing protein [Colwelliaceae bacterium 6441]
MSSAPVKVQTSSRINSNLGLMQAGSTVSIDISTPAGQKGKFRSVFVGFLSKQYVLIQFPDSNKLGNFGQFITQGAGVTVRGLIEGHEGSVAAFVSSIKQTLQIPSKLIVLDFPKSISVQSLRKSIRVDTDIQSKVRVEKNVWQGMITDLSLSGCQIMVDNGDKVALTNDKSIDIVIESFPELSKLKFAGQICSIKQLKNGVSLGVQLTESSRNSAIKLLHHVITIED